MRTRENTALDRSYSDMKCRRLGGVIIAVVIMACAMTFYLFSVKAEDRLEAQARAACERMVGFSWVVDARIGSYCVMGRWTP